MFRFLTVFALAALSLTLDIHEIAAQEPTSQQRDAVRASCRSDFMANCSGVQPGGSEALKCLVEHSASLSASCKMAVEAVASPQANPKQAEPPTAAPVSAARSAPASPQRVQPREDQIKAVQQACTLNDFLVHCSWIAPTSPELVFCLKANAANLSPACLHAVQSLSATGVPADTGAPALAAPPPTAVKASAPPSSRKPGGQQLGAVRAACRSDFMAHCASVQPGGTAALRCLQRHSAQLSHACQRAVTALGQSEGATAAAPFAAPAPSSVAPIGPMPMLRPREALTILRTCGADQRTLCPNVQPGGGRLISCLAEHASALSPTCYGVLSAAARR